MKKQLLVSDNVRFIEKPEGVMLYHSLFGNPTIVSRDMLTLFEYIKNGRVEELELEQEDIEELRANYYLVENIGDDRVAYDQFIQENSKDAIDGKKVQLLDLLISEKCNFGCQHCILFGGDKKGNSGEDALMNAEQAIVYIDRYVEIITKNGGNRLSVHFGSAEPLLNWSVLQAAVDYVETVYSNFETKFSINTNLTLINKERAIYLRDHKVEINASLDGDKQANDSIRVFKNGKGTYDAIMGKIKLLEEVGYPISGVSLTITNKNYKLISRDFVKWCKSMNFQFLAFDVDLLGALSIEGEDIQSVAQKLVSLYKECEELGMEPFGTWTGPYNHLTEQSVSDGDVPFFCGAFGGKNISVSPSGTVRLCSYASAQVGKITDLNFGKGSTFGEVVYTRLPGQEAICKGCDVEGFCAGQCHATREGTLEAGNVIGFEQMCDFYRTVTKLLLERNLEKNLLSQNTLITAKNAANPFTGRLVQQCKRNIASTKESLTNNAKFIAMIAWMKLFFPGHVAMQDARVSGEMERWKRPLEPSLIMNQNRLLSHRRTA